MNEGGIIGAVIVTSVVGIPALILALNLTWLKIWLAPKVYLIEYTASLLE